MFLYRRIQDKQSGGVLIDDAMSNIMLKNVFPPSKLNCVVFRIFKYYYTIFQCVTWLNMPWLALGDIFKIVLKKIFEEHQPKWPPFVAKICSDICPWILCSWKVTVFLELCSRKYFCFSQQTEHIFELSGGCDSYIFAPNGGCCLFIQSLSGIFTRLLN